MAKQAEQYDPLPNTLTELGDTPNSYAGQGGKVLVVNAAGDALELSDHIIISPASPHVCVVGDMCVSGHIAAKTLIPTASRIATFYGFLDTNPAQGLLASVIGDAATGPQIVIGLLGAATSQGTPTYSLVRGLQYQAAHNTPSDNFGGLVGAYLQISSGVSGTGAISVAKGLEVVPAYWGGAKPNTVVGVDVGDQGAVGVGTIYGLRMTDQIATTSRLLELGPGTPYLRLLGGGDPPTDKSNLLLKFGNTLYRIVKTGNYMTLEAA